MRESRNDSNIVDINQFKRRRSSRSRDAGRGRRPGHAVPSGERQEGRSASRTPVRPAEGQAARSTRPRSAAAEHEPARAAQRAPERAERPARNEPRRLWRVQDPTGSAAGEKKAVALSEKTRWTLIGMVALVAVLAVTGVYLTLSGTLFSVRQVEFAGVVTLDQNELLSMTGIAMGDNLLALDTGEVSERLAAHPMLDVVRVDRRYPHTVYIQIRERQPWAVVVSMGNYLVLDDAFTVMAVRSELPAGQYPIITGVVPVEYEPGSSLLLDDAPQQKALEDLLHALYAEDAAEMIDTVDISNAQNITMVAENGISIVVGDTERIENKAMWVAKMLPRLTQQGYLAGTLRVGSGRDFSFIPAEVAAARPTPAPTAAPTGAPEDAGEAAPSPAPEA